MFETNDGASRISAATFVINGTLSGALLLGTSGRAVTVIIAIITGKAIRTTELILF